MTPDALPRLIAALAAGALKGRHVYGVAGGVELSSLPPELTVKRLDATALLVEREWPRGEVERRRAVAAALGEALSDLCRSDGPLLVIVERADPLLGELNSLAPLYDRFTGDDRMLIFRCAAPVAPVAATGLADAPPGLLWRSGAALRRLSVEFKLDIVETDTIEATP